MEVALSDVFLGELRFSPFFYLIVAVYNYGMNNGMNHSEIYGRILRGATPKDFETLSDNPNRRVVMFMPQEELEKIEGLDGYNRFIAIGYSEQEIENYLKKGIHFKLITFPADSGVGKAATWENVIEIASEAYPELAGKLRKHTTELESIPYGEIVKECGYDIGNVDRNDPRYMDPQRFAESEGSLAEARSFLYHTLNLNSQFTGDGYTRTNDGQRGVRELIGLNRPISEIADVEITDMEVMLPSEQERELRGNWKVR